MLYKVAPGIRIVSANEDFSLADLTTVSLKNSGTYPIKWGFGDGTTLRLEEGQTVGIPAEGSTVFTSTAVLRIEFEKPDIIKETDFPSATLIFNRLTELSALVGGAVAK